MSTTEIILSIAIKNAMKHLDENKPELARVILQDAQDIALALVERQP